MTFCKRGKISFQKGGGINIIFGPKYRPLEICGNSQEFAKGKIKNFLLKHIENLLGQSY
jgi:hypothetical protein